MRSKWCLRWPHYAEPSRRGEGGGVMDVKLRPDFATVSARKVGWVLIVSRECRPVPGWPPRLYGTEEAAKNAARQALGGTDGRS